MYVCMCSTYVSVHIHTHYMYVCIYIFLKKREIERFGVGLEKAHDNSISHPFYRVASFINVKWDYILCHVNTG